MCIIRVNIKFSTEVHLGNWVVNPYINAVVNWATPKANHAWWLGAGVGVRGGRLVPCLFQS